MNHLMNSSEERSKIHNHIKLNTTTKNHKEYAFQKKNLSSKDKAN